MRRASLRRRWPGRVVGRALGRSGGGSETSPLFWLPKDLRLGTRSVLFLFLRRVAVFTAKRTIWPKERFFLDTAAIALRTPTIGIASCLALGIVIGLRSRSLGLVVALGSAALLVRPVQAGEQKPSMSRWGGQPARLLRKVCHVTAMRGPASLTLAPSLTLTRCATSRLCEG